MTAVFARPSKHVAGRPPGRWASKAAEDRPCACGKAAPENFRSHVIDIRKGVRTTNKELPADACGQRVAHIVAAHNALFAGTGWICLHAASEESKSEAGLRVFEVVRLDATRSRGSWRPVECSKRGVEV